MRRFLALAPLAILLTACAQGCAVVRALYVAVVHDSYAPSKAERAAIRARGDTMARELPRKRLAVQPVAIMGRPVRLDAAGADAIAERLRAAGFPSVAVDTAILAIPFEPGANELAIFWSRYRALADTLRAHPRTDVDYVLLVDVFGRTREGRLGAVHAMAVTASGEMAYWGFWNAHQPLFKDVAPRSLDDAARMVASDLARRAKTS